MVVDDLLWLAIVHFGPQIGPVYSSLSLFIQARVQCIHNFYSWKDFRVVDGKLVNETQILPLWGSTVCKHLSSIVFGSLLLINRLNFHHHFCYGEESNFPDNFLIFHDDELPQNIAATNWMVKV